MAVHARWCEVDAVLIGRRGRPLRALGLTSQAVVAPDQDLATF